VRELGLTGDVEDQSSEVGFDECQLELGKKKGKILKKEKKI
tara:strand:+ start:412 stop:534 length:123 start_codon:yes stop_codon:yes gene_type:complete